MNNHAILSLLDRSKHIVRIFTGIYSIDGLEINEHIFVNDLICEYLKKKKCITHISTIIDAVSKETYAHEETIRANLSLKNGYFYIWQGRYGLNEWLDSKQQLVKIGIDESLISVWYNDIQFISFTIILNSKDIKYMWQLLLMNLRKFCRENGFHKIKIHSIIAQLNKWSKNQGYTIKNT